MQELKAPTTDEPLRTYLNPLSLLRGAAAQRELLWRLGMRNIRQRYRGSALGMLWSLMIPLVMLAVYTFVFSVIFKARWGEDAEGSRTSYALTVLCGLMVYNIFAESVTAASHAMVANVHFVKRVVFPLEVIPLSLVLASLFQGVTWLIVLLVGQLIFEQTVCWTAVFYPLVLLPLVLLTCGVSWFVASAGTFVRDIVHIVTVALPVLFFMTPIFYSIDMVPAGYRWALRLNPLADMVGQMRGILIHNSLPDFGVLAVSLIVGAAVCQGGYAWFMKTRRGFADVL